jgi:hypothetical protein
MTTKIQSGYRRLRASRLGRAPFLSLSNATMLATGKTHEHARVCVSACYEKHPWMGAKIKCENAYGWVILCWRNETKV